MEQCEKLNTDLHGFLMENLHTIRIIIPAKNYVTNFALHFLRCVPPFGADAPLSPRGGKFQEGINVSYLIAVVIIVLSK